MIPPTLAQADYPVYLDAMNTYTAQRVDYLLMKRDHTPLSNLRPIALDGQVNFEDPDSDDTTLRTANFGMYDPDHQLRVDTDAPTDGMTGSNRLIRATVSNYIPALGRWVSVHAFTGVPDTISRNGLTVAMVLNDKSAFHLRTTPRDRIPPHSNVVKAIHDVLYQKGERFFRFPAAGAITDKTNKTLFYGGPDDALMYWKVLRKLARNHGLQLFYDGAGYCVLRKIPTDMSPIVTLDARNVTEQGLTTQVVLSSIRNGVIGRGHGTATHPEYAPAGHEFSAAKLAIGDVPWTNLHYTEDTGLRGKALRAFTKDTLDRLLTQSNAVGMTTAPLFHLDPLDRLRLQLSSGRMVFSLHKASVAFGDGGGMVLGTTKSVKNPVAGRAKVAA